MTYQFSLVAARRRGNLDYEICFRTEVTERLAQQSTQGSRSARARGDLVRDDDDIRDLGINAAITLWHITDWLAKSDETAVQVMRQKEFTVTTKDPEAPGARTG